MKQLICEMCGGNDLIKQDGVFVCQSCGCKYSVEEAKKMMVEGTVDVSGSTVKIDNSELIDNYYKMAEKAYESKNLKDAESYCNKIIEISPNDYKAWFLKGKSVGWQSTRVNNRIKEAINCFAEAFDNASDEEKDRMRKEISQDFDDLFIRILYLGHDDFIAFPSKEMVDWFQNSGEFLQNCNLDLLNKCGVLIDGYRKRASILLHNTAVDAWVKIASDYGGVGNHPNQFEWRNYIQRGDYVLRLFKVSIDLSESDGFNKVKTYEEMIAVQEKLIDSCSYTFSYGKWVREYSLADSAKKIRIDQIETWKREKAVG